MVVGSGLVFGRSGGGYVGGWRICGWSGVEGDGLYMVYGGVLGMRVMGVCVCGCLGDLKGEYRDGLMEVVRKSVGVSGGGWRMSLGCRLELGGLCDGVAVCG